MAILYLKIRISVRLRVYSSMHVHLSSRTAHDHRPRSGFAHNDCPMGPAFERMAALLLRLSRRNIAVAPTGLAPMAPSRRAAMFTPGEKWVPIMIPAAIIVTIVAPRTIAVMVTITVAITVTITITPFDSVIPVFVLVMATALR